MKNKITIMLYAFLLIVGGILAAADLPEFSTEKPASLLKPPVGTTSFTFTSSPAVLLPETIEHHSNTTSKLLRHILNANLPEFVFFGTDKFKTFEQDRFNALARQWGPQLSGGYGLTYLGELKKGCSTTTVWKLRFFGGGDDALVVLGTNKRGTVESFSIL